MINTYDSTGGCTFSSDRLPLKFVGVYNLNLTQFTNFTPVVAADGYIGAHAYYVLDIADMPGYPVVISTPQNMMAYTSCTPIQQNGVYTKLLIRLTYWAYGSTASTNHKLRIHIYSNIVNAQTSTDMVRVYSPEGYLSFTANSKIVQMSYVREIGCLLQKYVDGTLTYWGTPGYQLDYSNLGTAYYSLPGDGSVLPYIFKPQCKRYPVLNTLTYFWGTKGRSVQRNRNILWGLFSSGVAYTILKTSEAASIIDTTFYAQNEYPAHLTFNDGYVPPYMTYIYNAKYNSYTACPYQQDDTSLYVLNYP